MAESERVVDIAANAVLTVQAAQSFVQWHLRRPWDPEWEPEWNRRLTALIEAVGRLP